MRKLIFLLLALCLSSPVFAATVIDSLTVTADGYERSDGGKWFNVSAVADTQFVEAGYNSNRYCINAHFHFPIPIPANATITSFVFKWYNIVTGNAKITNFNVGAFDSSGIYAITDSSTFGNQFRKQTTAIVAWNRNAARTKGYIESPDLKAIPQELQASYGAISDIMLFFNDTGTSTASVRASAIEEDTPGLVYPMKLMYTYTVPDDVIGKNKVHPAVNIMGGKRIW